MTADSQRPHARLHTLAAYRIVGSAPEGAYDDLARLAAKVCGTPVAFITFVDDERQWFKASIGSELREAPLEAGFCPIVVATAQPLVIEDALADGRYVDNPALQGAAPVRFYAGTPLLAPGGDVLGTLCVVDGVPRRASEIDMAMLAAIARQVVAQLELRRRMFELSAQVHDEQRARQRLGLLSGLAARLLLDNEPERDTPAIAAELGNAIGADGYLHYLLEPDGHTLRLAGQRGLSDAAQARYGRMRLDEQLCAQAARERVPLLIDDTERSDVPGVALLCGMGLHTYACHPLVASGRLIGTLAFAKRQAQAFSDVDLALMRAAADLLAMAVERKRAQERLSDESRRKDEFIATLAHELRNPLAPLRNALQMLRLAEGDAALRGKARDIMDRQLGQMVRLIDDLLDVSRITRGRIALQRAPIELSTTLRDAVDASFPLVTAANHKLLLDLPAETVVLDADATRLAQVFANLLDNSVKYTEPGGQITLRAALRDGGVVVSVADTGIGIAADALPRVFELFAQVGGSHERGKSGLGIGLTLVRRLVELHGGTVQAHSAGPGQGSEFSVWLPVSRTHGQGAESLPAPAQAAPRRILVVDDNRDAAHSLGLMLELQGHETRTAYDGCDALETAETYRPDVVLLDLGMPRMNGYDTCHALRERDWGRHATVVALTGWGQDEDRRRTAEAGFDFHLVKPVDPAALDAVLAGAARRGAAAGNRTAERH